jgi:hypothetical protein
MLGLTLTGQLGMQLDESGTATVIYAVSERVTAATASLPFLNVIFSAGLLVWLAWFVRRAVIDGKKHTRAAHGVDSCHKL